MDIFDSVTLVPVRAHDMDRIVFSRLNGDYEPYIRLCRLFLSRSTLTLQASRVESFSLFVPMERLFEAFIASVLSADPTFFFGPGTRVHVQKPIGYLAVDKEEQGYLQVRPDILVDAQVGPILTDTKYKPIDGYRGEGEVLLSDMYQVATYAMKVHSTHCVLLYPGVEKRRCRDDWVRMPHGDVHVRAASVPLLGDLWRRTAGTRSGKPRRCLRAGGTGQGDVRTGITTFRTGTHTRLPPGTAPPGLREGDSSHFPGNTCSKLL